MMCDGLKKVADMLALSRFDLWNGPVAGNLAHGVADWADVFVLELGAGDGLIAGHLRQLGAIVFTLDIGNLPTDSTGHVIAASEMLPFASASFDVVVSCSTLQYVAQELVLAEAARVLRSGGLLLLHENGAYNPFALISRALLWVRGFFHVETAAYRGTVRRYLRPGRLGRAGWAILRWEGHYLLGPIHTLASAILGEGAAVTLRSVDGRTLRAAPKLKGLAWFHCIVARQRRQSGAV